MNIIEEKGRRLASHLQEASLLASELKDHLPLASPGRGYIEWEQLTWMAEALAPPEAKKE